MALLTLENLVLGLQGPSGFRVIELFDTAYRLPTHKLEASTAMFLVTVLAWFALDSNRRVKPLVRSDALGEILVIMTPETLVASQCLSV